MKRLRRRPRGWLSKKAIGRPSTLASRAACSLPAARTLPQMEVALREQLQATVAAPSRLYPSRYCAVDRCSRWDGLSCSRWCNVRVDVAEVRDTSRACDCGMRHWPPP